MLESRHINSFLDKIQLLEERVGAKTEYQIMDPFDFNPQDTISLQEAATKIAHTNHLKMSILAGSDRIWRAFYPNPW